MKRFLYFLLTISLIFLASCSSRYGGGSIYNTNRSKKKIAPSGKFRNPTMFSRVNPFQGRAKAKLTKNKKKQQKYNKQKSRKRASSRKYKKPGRNFGYKRTVSKKRIRSSGSRSRSKSSGGRRNKNLFNTRKK